MSLLQKVINEVEKRNNPELLSALKELHKMIGQDELKEKISQQVIYLFDNTIEQMLHTVIYGPPGTGKTTIGKILCRIWTSMGRLPKFPENTEDEPPLTQIDTISGDIMEKSFQLQELLDNISRNEIPAKKRKYYDQAHQLVSEIGDQSADILQITDPDYEPCDCEMDDEEFDSETEEEIDSEADENTSETESFLNNFVVATRVDFISQFIGGTAEKSLNFLKQCLGKVLFIDEAYSLYTGREDIYGMEALNVLNQFMSENAKNIIIIFAGYREQLEESIFAVQPGFKRRCTWTFETNNYTSEELCRIFRCQYKHKIPEDIPLLDMFKKVSFSGNGGDTEKLVFYISLEKAHDNFFGLNSSFQNQLQRALTTLGKSQKQDTMSMSAKMMFI